ncbi:MAG: hypothetical protein WD552_02885 [Candidatus Paceibacterota bacterium]
MKRLSALIWLAILVAVVPLLALPLLLMKALVVLLALIIAIIGYSLFRDHDTEGEERETTTKTPSTRHNAESTANKAEESHRPEAEPVDITDPETDRSIATNSYEHRRRLHNN